MNPPVLRRMRRDWNRRAFEDAYYYTAFGRRGQNAEEFFETAAEVLAWLRQEMKHVEAPAGSRRLLEIGCGPGRLMRPLAEDCSEIHGVDVSSAMVELARANLSELPHAHVHANSGADLAAFKSGYFDFVYSYAVFQHIPSRKVVFRYLTEAVRTLKDGGILTCQLNGLPPRYRVRTTWDGTQVAGREVLRLAAELNCQVLALDGLMSQYMWFTWRKRAPGWKTGARGRTRPPAAFVDGNLRLVAGRSAAAQLAVRNLPPDCGITDLVLEAGGTAVPLRTIGPRSPDNITEIGLHFDKAPVDKVPPGAEVKLQLLYHGEPLCQASAAFSQAAMPGPVIVSVSDATNYLSALHVVSRSVKVFIDYLDDCSRFSAQLDGVPIRPSKGVCVDIGRLRFEFNCPLPELTGPGSHRLTIRYGLDVLTEVHLAVGLARAALVFRHALPGSSFLDIRMPENGLPRCLGRITRLGTGSKWAEIGMTRLAGGRLPFPDASFDGVVADWNPASAGCSEMAPELRRILKQGGRLCLDVPFDRDTASVRRAFEDVSLPYRFSCDLGPAWRSTSPARVARRGLALWSFLLRVSARLRGERPRRGGEALFFGTQWNEAEGFNRLNTCVRCARSYSAEELASAGVMVPAILLALYRCPDCGTVNIRTRD